MKIKPEILVTNDDGITAPGLKTLVNCLKKFGNLTVIAPAEPMSGVGHAITMRKPIVIEKSNQFAGIEAWACHGTPADCVKYGLAKHFEKLPDLVVSGINHGSNASVNMIYSGTVAAAVEGALYGVSSIAFSSTSYDENADLSAVISMVRTIVPLALNEPIPRFTLWNVNVPDVPDNELMGYRFCRQSLAQWREEFKLESSENGRQSFWLTGKFICDDKDETTDIWALENKYASLVPVSLDLTAHDVLEKMKTQKLYEKI